MQATSITNMLYAVRYLNESVGQQDSVLLSDQHESSRAHAIKKIVRADHRSRRPIDRLLVGSANKRPATR
jgi:hypothetical protein